MNNNDIIGQFLEIEPVEDEDKTLPTTYRPSLEESDDVDNDAKYVRQNLYDIIEKGHGAIDELLSIADQSQHPRAYEVLSGLMKTMVETNKDLMNLHDMKKKLKKEDNPNKTVNNNLFVGSTTELLKMMNKEKDE